MSDISQIAHPHEYLFDGLFRQLDSGSGILSSESVVNFLRGSTLPVAVLGRIWEVADYEQKGSLDRKGFYIALKLVAAAQQGHPPNWSSLSLPLNPPIFGSAPPPSAWGISQQDQVKYDAIFDSLGPEDGKVPGSKVRPVLLNSGLNANLLAKIWEMSDMDKDGFLDRIEMNVALHLVYRALQGEGIPRVLPDSLIHPSKAALRRASIARSRAGSIQSLEGVGLPSPAQPDRPFSVHAARAASVSSPMDWPVPLVEYAGTFTELDKDRDGYVNGVDVKDTLVRSGLPPAVLASLWTVTDISQTGMLNVEQFALIMYLIKEKLRGVDYGGVLPPHLIPPSLRNVPEPIDVTVDENDPDVKKLLEEIEELEKARVAEEEQMQKIEADMNTKKTTMRQIQVELKTLETTAKQLERQKDEAQRRLKEMDTQLVKFSSQSDVFRQKITDTEKRLKATIEDGDNAKKRMGEDMENIQAMANDQNALENQKASILEVLQHEQNAFTDAVSTLSLYEREIQVIQREEEDASKSLAGIQTVISQLNASMANHTSCAALVDDFSRFSLRPVVPPPQSSPFPDPFVGAPKGGKAPPPRPAPPRGPVHDPFADTDPFSQVDAAPKNATGFADFANFGAF